MLGGTVLNEHKRGQNLVLLLLRELRAREEALLSSIGTLVLSAKRLRKPIASAAQSKE